MKKFRNAVTAACVFFVLASAICQAASYITIRLADSARPLHTQWRITPGIQMSSGKGTLMSKTIRGDETATWYAKDPRTGNFIVNLDVDEVGGSRSVRCVKNHIGPGPNNWKIEVEVVAILGRLVATKCALVEE